MIDTFVMYFLVGLVLTTVIADMIESAQLGRTSQISAILRGEDPRHGNDDRTKERVSHIEKIKKAAISQFKLRRDTECCICLEHYEEG